MVFLYTITQKQDTKHQKNKHLAPAEKLGFFLWLPFGCQLVANRLPIGCQVVNKTAKNKAAKTATSRVNTDF